MWLDKNFCGSLAEVLQLEVTGDDEVCMEIPTAENEALVTDTHAVQACGE